MFYAVETKPTFDSGRKLVGGWNKVHALRVNCWCLIARRDTVEPRGRRSNSHPKAGPSQLWPSANPAVGTRTNRLRNYGTVIEIDQVLRH